MMPIVKCAHTNNTERLLEAVTSKRSSPKEKASAAAPLSGEGPVQMRPETGCQQRYSHVEESMVLSLRQRVCLSLCTACVA